MDIKERLTPRDNKRLVNTYLKQYTGKKTVLEAKMELGRRLALVYSAAHDQDRDYGIDVEDRWLVEYRQHDQSYMVSHRRTKRADDWYVWAQMTINSAYQKVVNPAIVMLDAGALEPWQKGLSETNRTHFDKRVVLLDWINPREVRALEAEAIDQYVKGRRFNRLSAAEGRLQPVTYDKTGMKAQIETGHQTYDSQINGIGTGNYWANTMHGDYIRPYQETSHAGRVYKPGELQEFDLQYYKDIGTPNNVLDATRNAARSKDVIIYVLFHFYKRGGYWGEETRVVHGYILTDEAGKLLGKWVTGPTRDSQRVVDGILPYLAWKSEAPGSAS